MSIRVCALLCLCAVAYAEAPPPGMPARTALRILEQATWGPNDASLAKLQTLGFNHWFKDQVFTPLSPIPDQPLTTTNSSGVVTTNTNVGPLQLNFFSNALTGNDQLRQRVAFALSEIWVVSNLDLNNASAFPPLLRIFQKRAFGNYEDLMRDVTLSPAMGHYLDMANNNKGNPARNTAANENYAREFMQLFTLGLNQLNRDGSIENASDGTPLPSYTQATVTNLAKMFTGWTYAPVAGAADNNNNPVNFLVPMEAHEAEHDTTAKSIFGVSIPAGTTSLQDLNQAIDIVFRQPSLPPFVSKQLIQHLVTSNPSPAYVGRVAAVFENDGNGVRGDMQAVLFQILTDPEARAGDSADFASEPNFGHFREPVLFLANLLRGLNGQLSASSNIAGYSNQLGQNLFYAPSVFSYFPPDYAVNGLLAPELDIFDTQTSVARTGVVNSAVFSGHLDTGTTFDLTPYIAAQTAGQAQFLSLVSKMFFHNAMSSQVQSAMEDAMSGVTAPADKAKAGLYIALTSSEYNVVH
jgi:uncharacterized protein (DUF1800 family)